MSKSLTQQAITFLQRSRCDAGPIDSGVPYVCCARNDDSLILQQQSSTDEGTASALSTTAAYDENIDDSIVSRNTNDTGLLPDRSECGREFIENRIYSGQVSAAAAVVDNFYDVVYEIISLSLSAEH
jgi:hypothetical protein